MTAAFVALAAAFVGQAGLFAWVLWSWNRVAVIERAGLLDRVQDPDGVRRGRLSRAVVEVDPGEDVEEPDVLPVSDTRMLLNELTEEYS